MITFVDVKERLAEALPEKAGRDWLLGANDHLGGARPIDYVMAGRFDEVLDAVDQLFA